jgi:hypothetical protein|uniref:BrxE family protein n=1 Tax=Leptospirillum ferriphilum TaxID=178606 RepID=A0A7C3R5P9_9BACT
MTTANANQVLPLSMLVLRLRALVLALGESVKPEWWKTKFMNETGFRFLERLYPRSAFRAAIHAAGRVACDVHDRSVGRIGVYHLFRLPESLEAEIHQIPPVSDGEFVERIRSRLGSPDDLMKMLQSLCGSEGGKDIAPGAKWIGTHSDLMMSRAFEKTAAVYYHSFSKEKPTFPYFSSEKGVDIGKE